ncbi:MAG: tol-pal system protein YbgF [Candidatus Cloacimonetes bacterium]|nr:tol-pal system protein YbgF [Candidatus Cloacimonadota bacterium]MDD3234882.1 tol-pal system protein YbgF [Candidatus Cloacimonadota bacterium]
MKNMLALAVICILLAGCVANKPFQEQTLKVTQLERSFDEQKAELGAIRKTTDNSTTTIDSLFAEVKIMSKFQQINVKDVIDDVNYLKETVTSMGKEQKSLRDDFANLQADNDDILDGFADRLAAYDDAKTNNSADIQDVVQLTMVIENLGRRIDMLEAKQNVVNTTNKAEVRTPIVGEIPEYEAAREEYERGNHKLSRKMLASFIANYPNSNYYSNALYWTGENYYAEDDYTSALREFQNVVSRYPDSWKAADAQLKIGLCYWRMGNPEAGRNEIESIRNTYPTYERMDLVDSYLMQIK